MENRKKIALLIHQIFVDQNIQYLVLSNVKDSIVGDIDFLIKNNFRSIRQVFLTELKKNGIFVILEKKGLAGNITLSLFSSNYNETLRIDIYNSIVLTSNKTFPKIFFLKNIDFFDSSLTDENGFSTPSHYNSFIYTLFRKLLKNDISSKINLITLYNSINSKSQINHKYLKWFEDFNDSARIELINYLESKSMSKNLNFIHLMFNKLHNMIFNKLSAPHIAFIGPDGCGKSTLIDNIQSDLNYLYGNFNYIHLRPTIIPATRNIKKAILKDKIQEIPNPHAYKPYNNLLSFIKFIFIFFDYLFGYIFIKAKTLKGLPVISDRYFYDIMVDPKRFRFKKIFYYQFFLIRIFLPRPDITFLLFAPSKIIYERKKDLIPKEIDRQNKEYMSISKTFGEIQLIDASLTQNRVYKNTKSVLLNMIK